MNRMRVWRPADKKPMKISTGIIFDIQKYCIHDGPGIRTIVFLKGCPLACQWCANPESQQLEPQFAFFSDKCIGDKRCVQNCPAQALSFGKDGLIRNLDHCLFCKKCVQSCAAGAIRVYGESMEAGGVINACLKDLAFYKHSQGGVTLSGGEPLMQNDFSLALLQELKKEGIHTAMETTGYTSAEIFKEIKKYTDLFLYDLKCIDRKKHQNYTGADNDLILENLRTLAKDRHDVIVRIPVVPGFNDDEAEIDRILDFLLSLDIKYPVNLLPYHRLGMFKYCALNMVCQMESVMPPDKDTIETIALKFTEQKITVNIGG